MRSILVSIIIMLSTLNYVFAKDSKSLHLPAVISNNMVLQQNTHVPIWGWASPNEKVIVKASWLTKQIYTKADTSGYWIVRIKTKAADNEGPFSICVSTEQESLQISNILFGEVWLASGQSNMEMPLKGWEQEGKVNNAEEEIANSDFPLIRMFTVKKVMSFYPKSDCSGTWQITSPKTAGNFSATAYFFAKYLYQKLHIPIGIIHSSWGGTPVESWISTDYIKKVAPYKEFDKDIKKTDLITKKLTEWLNKLKVIHLDSLDQTEVIGPFDFEDEKYSSPDYDDSDWGKVKVPGIWDVSPLKDYKGVVWLRKEFEWPENINPDTIKLFLDKIDEMDETFINGIKVGSHLTIGDWVNERVYFIDKGILKPGKNVIAVKITNVAGAAGIYGKRDVAFFNDGKEIVNLSGWWKYKIVGIIFSSDLYVFSDRYNYSNMPELPPYPFEPTTPTLLYNAMIAPLIPYRIRGVIWYQGESNVGNAEIYKKLFPLLIQNWRDKWRLGDFPFYYVQIAPFLYSTQNSIKAAELRWAQFLALREMDNLGMVVTTDIGDINNIHPSNKQDVGKRLALWALNKTYGEKDIVCSGPLYAGCRFEDSKAVVNFDYVDGGLVCKGNRLTWFEAAGEDGEFYPAQAQILDDKVIVTCDKVNRIREIRFGWADIAEPNLFNKAGLPAAPFKCSFKENGG